MLNVRVKILYVSYIFNTPSSNLIKLILVLIFFIHSFFLTTSSDSQQPNDGTIIAYVSSSTDNQSIRAVNPDGTGDRPLWLIPAEVDRGDGIGFLSWHPEATELAFDSGHDWRRSISIRDLYSVVSDGSQVRRLSRPPAPEAYTEYPTGEVTFRVSATELGDVELYIEGATEPVVYFARSSTDYIITQTVADLGPDVRQYIRLVE